MQRNLLPQQLGFSPGTSLIGNFGSTDTRFKRLPMSGTPEPFIPGPGAHSPQLSTFRPTQTYASSAQWSIKGTGHTLSLASEADAPGPGAYGDELHPLGGMLTGLRRQWPGVTSCSSFGTNASLPTLKAHAGDGLPGPGAYNIEECAHFLSRASPQAASPFVGRARQRTGSRLPRDMDAKRMASFASVRAAHQLPAPGDESGAATHAVLDGPSPAEYHPTVGTISAQLARHQRSLNLRLDCGQRTSFHSTAQRSDPAAAVLARHPVAALASPQPSLSRPRAHPRPSPPPLERCSASLALVLTTSRAGRESRTRASTGRAARRATPRPRRCPPRRAPPHEALRSSASSPAGSALPIAATGTAPTPR